jgi:phosphopantothenoylcysteine decarboxylase/phosphopantothenate--cysteine ligase
VGDPILQHNIQLLQGYGYHVVQPVEGRLACGDIGSGKMPPEELLLEHILLHVAKPKDLQGKRLLVTAGPTQEAIDPVRFITNHSSGKMGYAIAKMAALRGAEVTLVTGPVSIKPFAGVQTVPVKSADDMFEAVTQRSAESDVIVMCSAVADYMPATYSDQKVKKRDEDLSIALTRTPDILQFLGDHKPAGQVLVGFSMETENLIENSRSKLTKKKADLICANSIADSRTGFGVDTNRVTLITQDEVHELPLCSKEKTADLILTNVADLINNQL